MALREKKTGVLYVVSTPIGNLEDITLRALRVLKEADLILAEDTRITRRLLNHYQIGTRLQSYHIYNEHQVTIHVADRIAAGENMALVSDAGTPSISDPGFMLVRACLERQVEVECLPGPTALIPALVNSGFPSDKFCFEGFLPHKKGRKTRLEELTREERTIILYESPHRIVKTLQALQQVMGEERRCSVSRELTKIYEETRRGTLAELITHFTSHEPKGEMVVVVEAHSL